jgi:hypothetical protein
MQTISNAFTFGVTSLDTFLTTVLANPYVSAALTIFVLLYAGLAAPNLPPYIAALFDSNIFKLLFLFAILVVRNYNTTVAIIMALAFVLSLQTFQRYRVYGYAQGLASRTAEAAVALKDTTVSAARGGVSAISGALEPLTGPVAGPVGTYPAMVDVNTGCGIPSSCDGLCGGLPIGSDAVLPPGGVTDEVSGLCGCDVQGPQGLKFPPGYENLGQGANY